MNQGYIKLHRKILEWEWYSDIPTKILFFHCLLKTNHQTQKWRGILIPKGSFLTSLGKLGKSTGLTIQQVRSSLNKLKSTHEITSKTTNKYSIISITNWDSYQIDNTQDNKQITNKQQTNNKQITTNKNDKNDKNDKNVKKESASKKFQKPLISEIQEYCSERKNGIDPERFFDHYEARDWMLGKQKMKNWKACVRTWERNNFQNQQTSSETTSGFDDQAIMLMKEHSPDGDIPERLMQLHVALSLYQKGNTDSYHRLCGKNALPPAENLKLPEYLLQHHGIIKNG